MLRVARAGRVHRPSPSTARVALASHICRDAFNARMVGEGILHHTCLQGAPNWVVEGTDRDYKLLDFPTQAIEGASVDPLQWRLAGEMGFQWAARYGHVSVSASLLRTRPLCQWNGCYVNKTGLGTASWVEFQNEVDKDWKDRKGYYSPYEYAAALSAFYDGHRGAMGTGYGVRTADPSMKVAMAGLVSIKLDYLTAMWHWFQQHRAGSWPGQALNVHVYCRKPTPSGVTIGVHPEECGLRGKLEALCAWRDAFVPAQEVWLSEFGYDTMGGPILSPPLLNVPLPGSGSSTSSGAGPLLVNISSEEVAGMWMLRSVLVLAAAGNGCVSRVHQYMLDDVHSLSTGQHATSGLLTAYAPNGSGQPKPGWWHYAAFTAWLSNYTFVRDVSATLFGSTATGGSTPSASAALPPGFYAYCFVEAPGGIPMGARPPAGARYALVAWFGTGNGTSAQVQLPVSSADCPVAAGAGSDVQVILPTTGMARGAMSRLSAFSAPTSGGTATGGSGATAAAAVVSVVVQEMPLMIMHGSATSQLRNGY